MWDQAGKFCETWEAGEGSASLPHLGAVDDEFSDWRTLVEQTRLAGYFHLPELVEEMVREIQRQNKWLRYIAVGHRDGVESAREALDGGPTPDGFEDD